ncbi:hypothetical protein GCU69_27515 [Streptomyces lycii]|uniref:DUF5753 domain-containing protein n=1 Tax=Streptomyces lycii TaxID=2654337 RepID=A0ABQ7FE58_9ACTN|nr:hypothetical protein GCU69_27515 [Streptomyces lycii]
MLQTRVYASAIHRSSYARPAGRLATDRALGFRLRRQEVLTVAHAPRFHATVHESALRVRYGGREVVRDQLLRLMEVSRLPNVTVQVFPQEADAPAFTHPFMVVEWDVKELSTVLVDQLEGSTYLGEARRVGEYRAIFERLSELALPPVDAAAAPEGRRAKDSLGLLQRLLYPLLQKGVHVSAQVAEIQLQRGRRGHVRRGGG